MLRTALSLAAVAAAAGQNIVQVAESDPNLSLLVQAVVAGGLAGALEGPGPLTVFAPDNFAFERLGRNVLDYVLNPHNKASLVNVLTYHVANGEIKSGDLKNGQIIPTLDAGQSLTVGINGGVVTIDGARVIKADVGASNGVIHIVDGVLVPSNFALPKNDILTTALATSSLSTLVTAVKAANLTEALAMPNGPYSVFAPTDAAFAKIPASELQYLLAHPDALREVLFYHLLDHRVYSEEITNFGHARTLNGQELIFFVNSTGVIINGVSNVIAANVDCTNGVVHLIDTVLLPKAVKEAAAAWAAGKEAAAAPTLNIVQLAQSVPDLSTLVKAVVAAGLADTLSGAGPFTVFAPNNEAFDRLPDGVLAYLLANPDQLKTVILYHAVAGNVSSSQLTNNETITTIEGDKAVVHIYTDRHHTLVFIDDAMVVAADNEATNGVVHIIDNVLFPPATRAAIAKATGVALRGAAPARRA